MTPLRKADALHPTALRKANSEERPFYASLNARVIAILDARKAGNNPPTKPITMAKIIPVISIFGVILKAKASSLKLLVWPVPAV